MTEREGAAYHQAGHAVIAYLRNVDFESVTGLAEEHHVGDTIGCNYKSLVRSDLAWVDAQSYLNTVQIEIGLAGPFAHGLYVGGFTPGKEVTETHIRAVDAYLKGSEDDANHIVRR